ncbi:MAG TPA: putative toxin-antitoxin system toxin component, PIN family [Blastocatellia bacterium]|nr:putative toxin-antitoxin system toxin component, PIN family [Blastocatellia bacterium]
MKIVLDTNVIIAALIARGVCHELLEHCVLRHTLLTSDFILDETKEKLTEKFGYPEDLADEAVALLRSRMRVVTPAELERKVCRDPDDDNVLALAVSGECDCIITGDQDLLVIKAYEGIDILTPRDFIVNEDLA